MSENREPKSPDRRAFFKQAGVGLGAAGVVAVGLAPTAEATVEPEADAKAGAYRETEHVRKAYRTARF